MADSSYNEDKKFILESLTDLKSNVKSLFENDNEIKVTLATINTKLMVVGALSSAVVSAVIAFLFKLMGGK